jgi:hypothetical protein
MKAQAGETGMRGAEAEPLTELDALRGYHAGSRSLDRHLLPNPTPARRGGWHPALTLRPSSTSQRIPTSPCTD